MDTIRAKQPLANFYLFNRYQSRQDFEAFLLEKAPPFDPKRPPKYWQDPKALASTRPSVVYNALAVNDHGAPCKDPETGRPFVDVLVLRKAEAATVNIPPPNTELPVDPEVPVPLDPLGPTQYLDLGDNPFEGVIVRDSRADADRPATYSQRDQQAIHAIAAKLGVQL